MTVSLEQIELVAFDVDGVVTDGKILFDEEGREMHAFHVHDGMGMVLAAKRGILLVAISGRVAPGVRARLTQLRMREIHLGISDKVATLVDVAKAHNIPLEHTCFVGDDINDLPVMEIAGISYAPSNAHPAVQTAADVVTARRGGEGVLREILDAIFVARGLDVARIHQ